MNKRVTIKDTFIRYKRRETTKSEVDVWKYVWVQLNVEGWPSCEVFKCWWKCRWPSTLVENQPSVHPLFPTCRWVLVFHGSSAKKRIWGITLPVGVLWTALSTTSPQGAQSNVHPSLLKVVRENSAFHLRMKFISGLPSTCLIAWPEPPWIQGTWKLLIQ